MREEGQTSESRKQMMSASYNISTAQHSKLDKERKRRSKQTPDPKDGGSTA